MNNNSITLLDYINYVHEENEYRKLFVNMDKAMKYLHGNNYYILSFQPQDIEILNEKNNEIKFNKISPIYEEEDITKSQNIYMSSFLQIGIYTKTLDRLTPDVLEENFDSLISFVPQEDVAYYRGIILRGSSVYLSDYANQKAERDLDNLQEQLGEDGSNEVGKSLTLSNGHNLLNESINDKIYNIKNKSNNESAFIGILLFPSVLLILGIIMMIINIITLVFS